MNRNNHLSTFKCAVSITVFLFFAGNIHSQTTFRGSFYSASTKITATATPPVPQPPAKIGTTAEDIINAQKQNALQNMGYKPPAIPPSDPTLAHRFILEQAKATQELRQQQQLAEIYALLRKEDLPFIQSTDKVQRIADTRPYREAFASLLSMYRTDKPLSVKKAAFLVENAWHGNTLTYQTYENQIAAKVKTLRLLMQKEKIPEGDNLAKNQLIQRLFSQEIIMNGKTVHKPYRYDFEDFMGEMDWSKMFVTKLLSNGKGQCHSMPLLYLIFAEELNAKAWLSLAPEHSFIIFNDGKAFFNFETTSGKVVSNEWLMQSGYINSTSIRNRLYLDTLSKNALMSTLVADLVMGYTGKFGYDDFMRSMVDTLLSIHPHSIQGLIFKADLLTLETRTHLERSGNPPLEKISMFPEAHTSYQALLKCYALIDALGYMTIPKEEYLTWLKNNPKNGTH